MFVFLLYMVDTKQGIKTKFLKLKVQNENVMGESNVIYGSGKICLKN